MSEWEAWQAPSLLAWARGARARVLDGGIRTLTAADAVVAAMVLYVVIMSFLRFVNAAWPWANEGDWKQWIWEYHRYWTPGAFPPGHVITDYQFRVQPLLYWLVMATLSHVMHPGVAARLLSVLAYVFTLLPLYRVTTRLSTHWAMGLCAVVIAAHDYTMFHSTMGGYPRSFAPALVFLLLDAWVARQHWRALLWLVLMGALYPSVLPGCGLAYGVACALSFRAGGGVRGWLVRCASVVAAGGVAGALAMAQNALALPWWGPVISLEEARQLPALWEGGRMKWLPLGHYWPHIWHYGTQPFDRSGWLELFHHMPWSDRVPDVVCAALFLACVVVVVVRGKPRTQLPWQVAGLFVAAAVSYYAARELAFRMYLPHRVLQHTLPYCTMIAFPVVAYHAARALRRTAAAALAVVLVPLFLLAGDGIIVMGWGANDIREPMMKFIREHTPPAAQFAGDLDELDQIPYFAARQVYVNWTMAHPFRLGYWHEMERRLVAMHDALYADDPARLAQFIESEKIDYLAIDPADYAAFSDRKLFAPIGAFVRGIWNARQGHFVLAQPPESAVVYRDERVVILDAKKLVAALALSRR